MPSFLDTDATVKVGARKGVTLSKAADLCLVRLPWPTSPLLFYNGHSSVSFFLSRRSLYCCGVLALAHAKRKGHRMAGKRYIFAVELKQETNFQYTIASQGESRFK